MNLNNERVKISYNTWISQFPNSIHDLDTNRFMELSLTLLENEDNITETEIQKALGINCEDSTLQYYVTVFAVTKSVYSLMLDSGYTK